MYTKDRDSGGTKKKWRIKRIDELNDDELDKFYCIVPHRLDLCWTVHRQAHLPRVNAGNQDKRQRCL